MKNSYFLPRVVASNFHFRHILYCPCIPKLLALILKRVNFYFVTQEFLKGKYWMETHKRVNFLNWKSDPSNSENLLGILHCLDSVWGWSDLCHFEQPQVSYFWMMRFKKMKLMFQNMKVEKKTVMEILAFWNLFLIQS